jgi:hypothetical protein
VTDVRIDTDALAEWSQTLDRLPPLAGEFNLVEFTAAPAGLPAAAELHRANTDALRALADVVASFDGLVDQLRSAATAATRNYSSVDELAASIVGASVRRH